MLARWWHHTLSQILVDSDETTEDILANLYQKCPILCTKILLNDVCAPQYALSSFVTMATYGVPDLLKSKDFSGHLWHFTLIFANGASYARSRKHINLLTSSLWLHLMFFELKITNILESSGWGLEKSEFHGNRICFSRRCDSCGTFCLPSFTGPCCKLAKIALLTYLT